MTEGDAGQGDYTMNMICQYFAQVDCILVEKILCTIKMLYTPKDAHVTVGIICTYIASSVGSLVSCQYKIRCLRMRVLSPHTFRKRLGKSACLMKYADRTEDVRFRF